MMTFDRTLPKTDRKRHVPALRAPVLPLAFLLLQTVAAAAEAPVTPGSVQDMFRSDRMPMPRTPPQVVVPVQSPPSQADPRARRFRVNAFAMSGNTVYRTQRLKRLLERFVDMELNLYDLTRAADVITRFYHDHGYTLARAVIPPQKVVDGVVSIQIVEGRFGRVAFTGNQRYSTAFLSRRTALLAPGALVTSDRLENNLLLMNDLPGVKARAVMQPGAEFGATDAEIQVKEKLVDGSVGIDNAGRDETGRNRLQASLNINSPFGWGDQLSLSGSSTQHNLIRYWKAGYSIPLDAIGTRLTVGSSKAAYDVSGALAALGVRGVVRTDEALVSQPLERSRDDNRWISVGLKRNRLEQSALGTPLSDDKVTVLVGSYALSHIGADTSVTNARFGIETNFRSGNDKKDGVFARTEFDVSHTAPFIGRWDIYLHGDLVHSKEQLPDTEKFSLGGPDSVRAFRPSEVRGDSGYLATAELRRPFSVADRLGVFRLTADAGAVTYKAPGYNDSRDHLRSIGVGASLYPAKGVVASIDIATPVGASYRALDGDNPNHRIWVNISASF